MTYGIREETRVQVLQKIPVVLALTVRMVDAIILQFDIQHENTDLYTDMKKRDYHGSRIDQAAHFGYDSKKRSQACLLHTER